MILAEKTYIFFCQYKDEIDLPWFSGFPKNCCEGASVFLGKAIKEIIPDSNIYHVKGESLDGEFHYWIEFNDSVIDITIEQFEGVLSPVYLAAHHPLIDRFRASSKVAIDNAFNAYDGTSDTYKNTLLVNLNHFLRGS